MTAWRIWRRRSIAFAFGSVGGAIFWHYDVPLAWLLGALTACLLATLAGMQLEKPGLATQIVRVVLGLAIGSAFSPALLGRAGDMLFSLALVVPFVLLIGLFGYHYFRRIAGHDPATAFYAAMPGGFQDMLAMGEDHGASGRTLALIHATRIIILVFLLPFLVHILGGVPEGGRNLLAAPWPSLADTALLIFCGWAGWRLAARIGIRGAAVIGPMVVSAGIHMSGLTEARPPMELINLAQLVIGVHIGCQYQGATLREIGRVVLLSVGFTAGLLALAAGAVGLVTATIDVEPISVLLAFAPGGQAEMNIIALVLGVDVAYVALHHLFRMSLVIIGAQVVFRLLLRHGQLETP